MSSLRRLLLALAIPVLSLAQTQIELQQSKYIAPLGSSTPRSGAAKMSDTLSVKDYGAKGDGHTDDLPAILRAFAALSGTGGRILFPPGTYIVSNSIVIPDKTSMIGSGRGDANSYNTVIKAAPIFPSGGTLVQMGAQEPVFGIRVENMTLDGSQIAGVCLANYYAEEQSAGRDLLLTACSQEGLLISGSGSQNSGPFEDLEIYPSPGTTSSLCVKVTNAIAFRGIRGITCNAIGYVTRPAVAMSLDTGASYSDIHVEHFATAISLGSSANSADAMMVSNGQFGPDVDVGVAITGLPAQNDQNFVIMGMSCVGCTSLLTDAQLGTNITNNSLGIYAEGDGAGNTKGLFSTTYGVGSQVFGPFHGYGPGTFGKGNNGGAGTLNVADYSGAATSFIETAGYGQGNQDLMQIWSNNGVKLSSIDSNGGSNSAGFYATNGGAAVGTGGVFLANSSVFDWSSSNMWFGSADLGLARSAPGTLTLTNGSSGLGGLIAQRLQLTPSGTQPACASSNRGTFWFTQGASGSADHVQVCAKNASDAYNWSNVF